MMKRTAMLGLATALALGASAAAFAEAARKVAIQVNANDPAVMNIALNNAKNLQAYYAGKGETVDVEIVTYGPGLHMFMADSPVKDRISAMAMEADGTMHFSACANTIAGMERKTGTKPSLLSEATVVPSGVVRLMELQEQGYSYIKP
ncbi:MAG: DsrE family protein [Zhengella sp.]|uniref:DsrE family protein n=1 Tax=Zhengella sp. TaxID=2282762 RepID=UPI003529B698